MSQPSRQKAVSEPLDYREDSQFFRSSTVQVQVDVTPQRRITPQGDLILRGYIRDKEIEVVFPGRRQGVAQPLVRLLQNEIQSVKRAALAEGRLATAAHVRQRLWVDGIWRARLLTERNGMPERRFQLVAARWRFRGPDGLDQVFGHLPGE